MPTGPFAFTKGFALINAVDLSDHVKSIDLPIDVEMLDDTVMGDDTKSNFPGLKNWKITVRFLQDFAASKVDATLFPLLGNATGFAIEVRADNAARSTTNPGYNATAILQSYGPVSGGVGEMLQTEAVFVAGGATPTLLRSTS